MGLEELRAVERRTRLATPGPEDEILSQARGNSMYLYNILLLGRFASHPLPLENIIL
jgi:hypothetical protein